MTNLVNAVNGNGWWGVAGPFGNFAGVGKTVPADTTAGICEGALWIKPGGAAGAQLYVNRGTFASCSFKPIDLGGIDLSGLTSTAAELNQLHSQAQPKFVSGNTPVVVPAGTTTLTLTPALHAGRILNLAPTGGLALTPPAATGTGDVYEFICSAAITGGSFTFDAKAGNASDVIYGWIQTYKATTFTPYINASNSNLLTLDGTTKGGAAIGDWFRVTDAALHVWKIESFLTQSGTIATPFSNH